MQNQAKDRKKSFQHWHFVTLVLVFYDIFAILLSYGFALWIRFDCSFSKLPANYLRIYGRSIFLYIVICLVIFTFLHLYRSIWRFASYIELYRLILATVITLVANVLITTIFFGRMPVSYYVFGIVLQFLLTVAIRFSYRFVLLVRTQKSTEQNSNEHVMLVGAGQAGQAILRDIKRSREINERVCCFIDDNPNKWNRYIDGIPVVGGRDKIIESCETYLIDKIYYAIPSADFKSEKEILNICNQTHCKLKKLPGMYQLMNGEVSLADMKEVQIEDLLGRDPIKVDMNEIFHSIKGKVILVTGGGGSIGSELCRQIAAHEPKELIIFDIYENNAYEIQLELKKKYPNLHLETIIGSVRDGGKMLKLLKTYRPQIVYHAAAHKHVPLMEDSPCEAIKNNVLGTFNTAFAAAANGCERFVLISTDKAVNPTNIMGASKRLCEMVIQTWDDAVKRGRGEKLLPAFIGMNASVEEQMREVGLAGKAAEGGESADERENVLKNELAIDVESLKKSLSEAKTEFVAVRFGNVLGSNGSVIPLFKKQIEAGGPVTVTHPDIIRYFMTIPEAVSLVLQAGAYAGGGEIFVFDMGEPVKIDTLARNLIRLSGHEPDAEIKIVYTGLRPGEKLFEEKLMAEEGLKRTKNELIHIGSPIPFDKVDFIEELEALVGDAYLNDEEIREVVKRVVVTYRPEEEKVG